MPGPSYAGMRYVPEPSTRIFFRHEGATALSVA